MAPLPITSISPAERERRLQLLKSIEGTLAIEGLAIGEDARGFLEQYMDGRISKAELDAALRSLALS